jgi:hypothetical protein
MVKYTDLELVTRVRDGVIAQGGPSMVAINGVENHTCAYRGAGGRKCAAGLLIDDEHYSPEWNLEQSYHPRVKQALIKSGVDESQFALVFRLQVVHDSFSTMKIWRENMDNIIKGL